MSDIRTSRSVAAPLLQMLIGLVLMIGVLALTEVAAASLIPASHEFARLCAAIATVILAVLTWKFYKHRVERSVDTELAPARAGSEWGVGLVLGASLFSAAAGVVWVFGGLVIVGWGGVGDLPLVIAMVLISSVGEELVFRGILFRGIERAANSWWALAVTAAFFGATHLFNPHATLFAAVGIALEAGVLLGACYLYTRRLWLPIGVHAGWNFAQGWIFGAPNSGIEAMHGLLQTRLTGPAWLSDGGFGLEASIPAVVIAGAAGVFLLNRATRRPSLLVS